jgi:hypothetical protein
VLVWLGGVGHVARLTACLSIRCASAGAGLQRALSSAVISHARCNRLFALLLVSRAPAGYGVAQRLLAMADAACSSAGGDPFCVATPLSPTHTAAAAAAAERTADGGSGSGSGAVTNSVTNNICGGQREWQECLERVRLAHESLLLLRALVASPGTVGKHSILSHVLFVLHSNIIASTPLQCTWEPAAAEGAGGITRRYR